MGIGLKIIPSCILHLIAALTLASFTLFLFGGMLYAKLIEPESLLLQILESNKKVFQFNLKVRVSVYDPEEFAALDEEIEDNLIPYELADKSFTQNVIWVRDEYFLIETSDLSGNPLHIFIWEFGGKEYSRNLQTSRLFLPEDVMFPYLIFFTKHLPVLKTSLSNVGVAPLKVKLGQQDSQNFYLLGLGQDNLVVDQNTFHVLEIRRLIEIWGRGYPLVAKFSNWDSKKTRIPITTKMFINGRLFKEVQVDKIEYRGVKSKVNKFLKTYRSLFPSDTEFLLGAVYGR